MTVLADAAYFFGGIFLVNAIPHGVSGLMGRAFQSPFAKPPGVGLSSSLVNVLWGFANLVVAYLLLAQVGHFDIRAIDNAASTGVGMLLMAVFTAQSFGRFHGGRMPPQ
jgi:hypothetical protein